MRPPPQRRRRRCGGLAFSGSMPAVVVVIAPAFAAWLVIHLVVAMAFAVA